METLLLSKKYKYSSGSGTSLVGMDPYNFVTQKLGDTIKCMVDELYCIIKKKSFY